MTRLPAYHPPTGAGRWLGEDWPRRAALVAGLALAALSLVNAWLSLTQYTWAAYHTAGAWTGLAWDLQHGEFYRPLIGPLGYGGTRYFPLYPALQALLGLIPGVNLYVAGVLVSLLATGLALTGAARLMTRLGVAPWAAGLAALFILAGQGVQESLAFPRGDMLAAGLSLWGLAWCARPHLGRPALAVAAGLFTLAFAAKFTCLFGLAAGVTALALERRWRQAAWLAGLGALGLALVVGLILGLSQGRFLESFTASATGGLSLASLPGAPLSMLAKMSQRDLGALLFLAPGLAGGVLLAARAGRGRLAALAVGYTLAGTALIFADPIVQVNHLVDLTAICVVAWMAAAWAGPGGGAGGGAGPGSGEDEPGGKAPPLFWPGGEAARGPCLGWAVLLAAAIITLPFLGQRLYWSAGTDMKARAAEVRAQAAAQPAERRGVFSSNAVYPVLAGQSPYLVDYFMFTKLVTARPSAAGELHKALRDKRFGVVALYDDCATAAGRQALDGYLGSGFCAALSQGYGPGAQAARNLWIYLPLGQASGPAPAAGDSQPSDGGRPSPDRAEPIR